MHERSFSVELFRVNANQLHVFLESNLVPQELMKGYEDLYSSHSVMREAARRFHNFLAAAMTLVDHTRVMIDGHYKNTPIAAANKLEIDKKFLKNPMTRFVQDLRNFMIHIGMPPLNRVLKVVPLPGSSGQAEIAAHWSLTKENLVAWGGWKSEAKNFLSSITDEEIDLIDLVKKYQDEILDYHSNLDKLLEKYHEHDVAESIVYKAELEAS